MPKLIYGRAHSRRREIFFENVKAAARQGRVLVIVPDQYSFEMEKQLYRHLGAKLFNGIESAGITTLCERIRREFGGSDKSYADDGTRVIAMYRAQSRLRREGTALVSCGKSLLKPQFVSDSIALISQLVRAGASPEAVMLSAETSSAGSPRLKDMSVIYKAYMDELKLMGLTDDLSEIARAADMARQNGYFKGKTVFFDNFTGFSADELKLVDAAAAQADDMVFSVLYDSVSGGSDVFAQTGRTISRLERIVADHGKKLEPVAAGGAAGQSRPLLHINNEYFSYSPAKLVLEDEPSKTDLKERVKVGTASDIYEECDYICAEIVRLTRECDYKYRDIAVITGALGDAADVISASAARYDIPYFVDRTSSALNTLPSRYLLSILDAAVSREYRTEKLMRIVKSPLSPFFDYDANDLEEFCMVWGVEGDMWLEPFTPGGDKKVKARIEENRRRLIDPIEQFRKSSKDAPAKEVCKALFTLLDSFKVSDRIYSQVRSLKLENETEVEFLRSFKQVWLGMVGAVKTIYEQMGDTVISLRSFYELLQLMLDSIVISSPPQKADCILIGDADRSRLSDVKVLFIMQANDGIFPRKVTRSGILRDGDIKLLEKNDIELELSPTVQLDSERIALYSAITAPSERLYVTYSLLNASGDAAVPSTLPPAICALFSEDITVNITQLPQDFFCTSYSTAFNSCLEHFKDNSQVAANVRESLSDNSYYSGKLSYITDYAGQKTEQLEEDTALRLFFPDNVALNSTCINDYYKCPFMYFCKYGLDLKTKQKVDMSALYFGNIVHYCLEMIMSVEKDGKRVYDTGFPRMTDKQIRDSISRFADDFVEREMGGSYGKTLTFRDALSRLKSSVAHMAMNFRDEMKDSQFLPAAFEYRLRDDDGEALLSVNIDGTKVALKGIVDRADIFHTDKGDWIRIVDYKSGKQKFSEERIYNGLDLQMIIYLLALTKGKTGLTDGELLPGGISYSHTRFVEPAFNCREVYDHEQAGDLGAELLLTRAKTYKPDGVMDGSKVVRDALNLDMSGVYTVFSFTSKGELSAEGKRSSLTREELKAMELFALDKVEDMGISLKNGSISPDPIEHKGSLPCSYCDYRALCKNALPLNPRKVQKSDATALREEIAEIVEVIKESEKK